MIPGFNQSGVLPPFVGADPTQRTGMSPYIADMPQVVARFSQTHERRAILSGVLNYRQELYQAGFTSGVQWFDGSFVEDVETQQGRAPRDIDVVTIADRPAIALADFRAFVQQNLHLFDPQRLKQQHKVDGYFIDLGKLDKVLLVNDICYWYGLFSHRRQTSLWKGMLQVPLDPANDAIARLFV
ncbi:DUF6932 family protein [Antarcticirhabdus aurantiaca]|uniref:Uncharacterized protein n=1 Tax=Antarcticirhabdus aurantiaca TaxID=2606717 RepID=A0ACD4NWE7_9HYPH|nr:hypothetical protein [Antarcticirhabdus aurantiaca]WAJ31147.1 hypothetical protein OXU80_13490 [Jeongeuplla avenae]